MIIPSEGIENRTGTVCLPAWVGSRKVPELEEFGSPDYLPLSSLALSLSVDVHVGSAVEGCNAQEPINVVILLLSFLVF